MSKEFKVGDLAKVSYTDEVGKIVDIELGCVCTLDTGSIMGWGLLEHIEGEEFEKVRTSRKARLKKEQDTNNCYLGIKPTYD